MNKYLSTECPFGAVEKTVDHILWDCKETEIKREIKRSEKAAKKNWRSCYNK
jgi:hypothetical protein